MSKYRLIILGLVSLGLIGGLVSQAFAGPNLGLYITLGGVVVTLVGIGVFFIPVVGPPIAAVLGAIQVVAILAGVIVFLKALDPPVSAFFVPPLPSAFTAGIPNFTNATYQPLPLPGGTADPLVTAANAVISDLNHLLADFNSGAPNQVLINDINQMGLDVSNAANQFDLIGINPSFTQADLNALQADIATSGMPAFEAQFLSNAGLSPADIDTLAAFEASAPINLAVPAISASESFHAVGETLVISTPEPGALALLSTSLISLGLISIFLHLRRQRV